MQTCLVKVAVVPEDQPNEKAIEMVISADTQYVWGRMNWDYLAGRVGPGLVAVKAEVVPSSEYMQ